MAIVIDASSPTPVKGNGTVGLTSSSFLPPDDSLLVVIPTADGSGFGNVTTASVTDSAGNTYTSLTQKYTASSDVEVWSAYLAGPQTNMTVSATFSAAVNNIKGATLTVLVLTGASPIQPGATATGTTNSVSLTPQALDSMVVGAIAAGSSNTSYTMLTGTTAVFTSSGATSIFSSDTFRSTNPTTSLTATSYGASNSLSGGQNICAVEILAAAPPNVAPTAGISADQTTGVQPGATVTLTLTDSDSDGTVASRTLRQISGPTVTTTGTPGNGAQITFTIPGTWLDETLIFGYKVTDNDGTDSAEATVTITTTATTSRIMIGGVEVPLPMNMYVYNSAPEPTPDRHYAWLTGDRLFGTSTNLNIGGASPSPLQYNISQYDDTSYFAWSASQPTRLTLTQPGDYLVTAGLPMTSNGAVTTARNNIAQEIRLNGTPIAGGYSDSSYIRNIDNHFESSNQSSAVIIGASANDYVEHYVYVNSLETSNIVTDNGHALYAEYIGDATVFAGRATQTTNSTNLNQATPYPLSWTIEDRVDSGYTHSTATNAEQIILNSAGRYLVFCNIPLSTTVQFGNITGSISLDGTPVSGGQFQQGMVRNADAIDTGSCHYTGLVTAATPNQILTVTTVQEAAAGTITVGLQDANIAIIKLSDTTGVYNAEATQVGGADDWNPTIKSAINWATDNSIDIDYFDHSVVTDNHSIRVLAPGDYFIAFNAAFTGSVVRASPKATVQVNGVDVLGLESKSGYIRNTSGADSSSVTIIGLLNDLGWEDEITVSMEANAATGAIDDQTPASIFIWYKGMGGF